MRIGGFAGFLRTELETRGPQLILLWLQNLGGRLQGAQRGNVFDRAVHELTTMDRRLLLFEMSGVPISKAGVRLFYKLDPEIIAKGGPRIIKEIEEVLASPVRAKLVLHMPAIDANGWTTVRGLPEWLCVPSLARYLSGSTARRLHSFSDLVDDLCVDMRADLRRSLGHARSKKQLLGILEKWKFMAAFPEPPIQPEDARFTPLSSPDLMRQEARVMRNCLARLIPDVVDRRDRYYYRYQGAERATVCVRRSSRNRQIWVVDEIKGPGNGRVSRDVKAQIRCVISGANLFRQGSNSMPNSYTSAD